MPTLSVSSKWKLQSLWIFFSSLRIPLELSEYIRLKDGEVVFKKELPKELKDQLDVFIKSLKKAQKGE